MIENTIKGRLVQKHDIEAHWNLATNFIPKQGELIVYDVDDTHEYERLKIGDGVSYVTDLPFIIDNASSSGASIVDVIELPEENIDSSLTYRLLTAKFYANFMWRNDSTCYVVEWPDGPTEEGESVFGDDGWGMYFVGYYNVSDDTVYGYFNEDTVELLREYINNSDLNSIIKMTLLATLNSLSLGWKTMENILSLIGSVMSANWGGVVTNIDDAQDENTIYVYLTTEQYTFINESWVKLNSGYSVFGRGVGAEVFNDRTNIAFGQASHAEGRRTEAFGECSHTEGFETFAEGRISHAEGDKSQAIGMVAHAEGFSTTASGHYSHSEGFETHAEGLGSHASGMGTIATGEGQAVVGSYNIQDANAKFIVGNGTKAGPNGAESRKNAFVVKSNGDSNIHGGLTVDGSAAFKNTAQFSKDVTVDGSITLRTVTSGGIVMSTTKVATEASISTAVNNAFKTKYIQTGAKPGQPIASDATAEGVDNVAAKARAHAEGWGVQALGECSHAEGINTVASGAVSHAEGHTCEAVGDVSHAEGIETIAEGPYSHTEGYLTITTPEAGWAHAEGAETIAAANLTHAEGYGTVAASMCQHTQGKFNIPDEEGLYAHIIGNGEDDENRSNAHTVDWDGNAWFAGNVRVGGTSYDDAKALATEEFVTNSIAGLVDTAPETLNTLNELATALGEDPNFATTITTQIGEKANTTYVDEQVSEATSTASTDAANKANQALADAKTYTNEQFTERLAQLLPIVTPEQEGYILMVVNGVWTAVKPTTVYVSSTEPTNDMGQDEDLYLQTDETEE